MAPGRPETPPKSKLLTLSGESSSLTAPGNWPDFVVRASAGMPV